MDNDQLLERKVYFVLLGMLQKHNSIDACTKRIMELIAEGKETDVVNDKCPGCVKVGHRTANEHHFACIYECCNGACRVHDYLVYGEDVEQMSDDQAMIELMAIMRQLNAGIARMCNGVTYQHNYSELYDKLRRLEDHYRREQ